MNEIKAIETYYNGYRFRSRLEARWAVCFDALGIKYEYEQEGYRDDHGTCYLPDFYLPNFRCLFEVKKGGVLKDGCMDPEWSKNSSDGKKIEAITESIKIRNDDKEFDYIILASGTPYDCQISNKTDCGLVFNGMLGVIEYSDVPKYQPITTIDGLPVWCHIPVVFESIALKDGTEFVFIGKRWYEDFESSSGKCEVIPIGMRCASIIQLMHGIIPRHRETPLVNPDELTCIHLAVNKEGSPIFDACMKARQARFEHGEAPRI